MSTDQITAIHQRLDAQDAVLSEIRVALVGNPALGTEGLVPRIKAVEQRIESHDKTMLKWAGVATGLSVAATAIKQRLFS